MCGRYTLTESPAAIVEAFADDIPLCGLSELEGSYDWQPRYNIAPTQYSLIASHTEAGATIDLMRWGLIPHWAKDEKNSAKLINARAETVAEKPSFKQSFRNKRCLVFADGYYEWTTSAGVKQPIFIKPKTKKIIAFAGIWAQWRAPDKRLVSTYSILTTESNSDLDHAHHRMPVLIAPENCACWVAPQTPTEETLQLLRPAASGTFAYNTVSNYVNSPRNEGPQCILPAVKPPPLAES